MRYAASHRTYGLLTIFAQSEAPPEGQQPNWLPAPKGADFSLYVRAYWQKTPVIDG